MPHTDHIRAKACKTPACLHEVKYAEGRNGADQCTHYRLDAFQSDGKDAGRGGCAAHLVRMAVTWPRARLALLAATPSLKLMKEPASRGLRRQTAAS